MAVSTLQQRQQEIHRPFQPLDESTGRAGRAIEAPQENYTGPWAWLSDTTRSAGNFYRAYLGSLGKREQAEDNDRNPLAREYYAQATFELEDMLRNSTPEMREAWKKDAAIRGQTTSEYLKGIKDKEVQQKLSDLGIPARYQYKAREEILDKLNIEGYQDVEKTEQKFNDQVITNAVKNGTAVYDSQGNINIVDTLSYSKELYDANKRAIGGGGVIMEELGISPDQYVASTPMQQRYYDSQIFNAAKSSYNTLLSEYLQPAIKMLESGEMPPEELRVQFDVIYNDAIRNLQSGFYPNESTRTGLKAYLDTAKAQLDVAINERGRTTTDIENNLKNMQAYLKTSSLLDQGLVGQLSRATTAFGGTVAAQLINANIIKDLASDLQDSINTWDDVTKQAVANRFNNAYYISTGSPKRVGSREDVAAAEVAVKNYIQGRIKATKDYDALSQEDQQILRNVYINAYMNVNSSLQGLRQEDAVNAMEYYANYIDVLNNPSLFEMLQADGLYDISSQLFNSRITSQVASKVLSNSSGPAGVLRTNSEEQTKDTIQFDTKSNKFVYTSNTPSLVDMASPIFGGLYVAREFSLGETTNDLNKIYTALVNSTKLTLKRDLNEEEQTEIAKYMLDVLKTSGVPESIVKIK